MLYERFTDQARKVMLLANQEAQRFNHEFIGSEHVLLGLIKEGSGVAAIVLKNLGISLERAHMEVERIVPEGPDMVTMGQLPQTPRVKKVIEYAMDEALKLGHDYIGTEHILLGLLRETDSVAATVLKNLGVDAGFILESATETGFILEKIRENVLELLGICQAKPSEKNELPLKCTSFVILGEEVPVRAKIKTISGYSAHADQIKLLNWLRSGNADFKKVFVVQGEEDQAIPFAQKIIDELAVETIIPFRGESVEL